MKRAILILLLVQLASTLPTAAQGKGTKITETEVKAAIQAVQDEIYDYSYEKHFFQMGENGGDSPLHWRSRLPIYIDPQIDNVGGRLIYKLMPYGEVLRMYSIDESGQVVLDDQPDLGFPPSRQSTKTVYLKDDDVCRMKHDWIKSFFEIDVSPGPETVQFAARRQKKRTGFSAWESAHSKESKRP
jgi:hypothetical protein